MENGKLKMGKYFFYMIYLINIFLLVIIQQDFNKLESEDLLSCSLSFAERAIFKTSRSLRVLENRGEGLMSIIFRFLPSTKNFWHSFLMPKFYPPPQGRRNCERQLLKSLHFLKT
jgi:hypothetical protein